MDGLQLTIGGAALTTIGGVIGARGKAWCSRNQRTEISPNPVVQEQSSQQALWKKNEADHADIFSRLRKVEAETAAQRADIENAKVMQGRMFEMISALYDRIIGGKKR